jgi:hypothetical protein
MGSIAVFVLACSGQPEDTVPSIGNSGSGAVGSAGGSGGDAGSAASGGGGAFGKAGRSGASGGSGSAAGSSSGSGGTGGVSGTAGTFGGEGGSSGATGGAGLAAGAGRAGSAGAPGAAGASSGGPTIGGCAVFPAEDPWNQDVSDAVADPVWTTRLLSMVGDARIHPDYGGDASELYGIPIGVVPVDQPLLDVTFDWWPEESDPGPYPFPSPGDALIEGGNPAECDGDCHLLVVQQGTCELFEGYACYYEDGWHCGNGARWDLTQPSYGQRPKGWTSADAAGLAIAPGIVRYDEVRAGQVNHAIRFTTSCTSASFVSPATHLAVPGGCEGDLNAPPMGLRVRLKADFDIASFSESARVVLTAMKRYGMILADNGSDFYFQGEAHLGWTDEELDDLKSVPASAFEAVAVPPLEQ